MTIYSKGRETRKKFIRLTYQMLQEQDASALKVRDIAGLRYDEKNQYGGDKQSESVGIVSGAQVIYGCGKTVFLAQKP